MTVNIIKKEYIFILLSVYKITLFAIFSNM